MVALDYSRLARIYDDYCRVTEDLAFFRQRARAVSGEILELMAGTGRISVPLLEDGVRWTGVDSCLEMLAVCRRKLDEKGLQGRLLCADVRQLPLRGRYSLVLLPFQGLTELVTPEDQLDLLRAAAGVLAVEGRFICTTHNPSVRLQSVDNAWHELGEFERADGSRLRLSLRARYDEPSGTVVGRQRIDVTERSGATSIFSLNLRFSLPSLEELTARAGRAGLEIAELYGDYNGAAYDRRTSPAIIAVLAKAA